MDTERFTQIVLHETSATTAGVAAEVGLGSVISADRHCDQQLIFHQFCLQADHHSPLPAEHCRELLKAQTLNTGNRGFRFPSQSSQV
jgi:hypothetical protein